MAIIKDEAWILVDNRPGNYSQAIGLANEVGLDTRIINIEYGLLSFLPNAILQSSLLGVTKKTKQKLAAINYFPKLIISAGRRSAAVALHIKKQSNNCSKIAQIMNPECLHQQFDFIILPMHDNLKHVLGDHKNIIRTIGSLTKVNDKAIKAECEKFASWFENYKKTKIALLIGGDSKNTQLSKDSAVLLVKKACEIAKNMNAKLLILNSRRTSKLVNDAIKSTLYGDYKFFNWQEIKNGENPYLAIVGFSDFFIVTGDSVSMISESCSTGKPVYIFDEKNISSKKHRKFHSELIAQNYARKIDDFTQVLENFSPKKLQETKKAAMIIQNALKN